MGGEARVFDPKKKNKDRKEGKGRRYSISFFVALVILHQDDLKNRMNSYCSSYHPGAATTFYLFFCLYPSSRLLISSFEIIYS